MFKKKAPKENPQDIAIRDLEVRTITFEASELSNTLVSAGGSYIENAKDSDVENARAMFSFLRDKPPAQVVGYLIPSKGDVLIQVNSLTVDRLTKASAKKVMSKLSGPTPVKIEVAVFPGKAGKDDRPQLTLKKDNKPPKN